MGAGSPGPSGSWAGGVEGRGFLGRVQLATGQAGLVLYAACGGGGYQWSRRPEAAGVDLGAGLKVDKGCGPGGARPRGPVKPCLTLEFGLLCNLARGCEGPVGDCAIVPCDWGGMARGGHPGRGGGLTSPHPGCPSGLVAACRSACPAGSFLGPGLGGRSPDAPDATPGPRIKLFGQSDPSEAVK